MAKRSAPAKPAPLSPDRIVERLAMMLDSPANDLQLRAIYERNHDSESRIDAMLSLAKKRGLVT